MTIVVRSGPIFALLAVLCAAGVCFAADPPKAKPATPRAANDPVQAIGSAITLPALTETAAFRKEGVVLAQTEVSPDAIVLIHLLGGKEASPERGAFWDLKAETPEVTNRRWRFELARLRREEPLALAWLSLMDGTLRFGWNDAAADEPLSGTLANCSLKIAAGKALKTTALRRPLTSPPWNLSLEEEVETALEIPDPPLRSAIKVEMSLSLPKETARYRFIGNAAIAPGESTLLEFMGKRSSGALRIRIEAEWKRERLELTAAPLLAVSEKRTIKLSSAVLKREQAECKTAMDRFKSQEQAIVKQLAVVKKGKDKDKGKGKVDTSAADRALEQIRTELKSLATLENTLADAAVLMANKKLQLPLILRVSYHSADGSIPLVVPKK